MSVEIAFVVVAACLCAAVTVAVALVVVAIGEGDAVADVEAYIELTHAARGAIRPGPALSDPGGDTSAAIGSFLATKEEARRALWASRRGRMQSQPTEMKGRTHARIRHRGKRRNRQPSRSAVDACRP